MKDSSLKPRRGNLQLALIIGGVVLLWYVVSMFVVLQP